MYDGTPEQHIKINEVYGNSDNKLLKSISSSGETLFIDFKKQNKWQNEKAEFEAFIKYNKFISACKNWLDVKTNILTSPNDPNTTNCSWLITANFGSYIVLNFKFIEVNSKTRVIFVNFRKQI